MADAASAALNVLFLSTPVGPLGSGLGGGVELTLRNIALALMQRGYTIRVVAPAGSEADALPIIPIAGNLQISAQTQSRSAPVTLPPDSVLENMWDYARQVQHEYDLLLNFAYDWLPLYLTPWFETPIAHLVSVGSLTDAMDVAIAKTLDRFPGTIGVHSYAQAATFPFGDRCRWLANGFDLSSYAFQPQPEEALAFVGRISPEKGLEDAIAAARKADLPLRIFGAISDEAYWQTIQQAHAGTPLVYEGFLPTAVLQQALGQCQGLLMTPKWVEAFGNVAIEALACGVPVVAYRRGGPAEIVQEGRTGWLVEPDSVTGLVEAIARLDEIDRAACRQSAEDLYSLSAMGDRMDAWFRDILARSSNIK